MHEPNAIIRDLTMRRRASVASCAAAVVFVLAGVSVARALDYHNDMEQLAPIENVAVVAPVNATGTAVRSTQTPHAGSFAVNLSGTAQGAGPQHSSSFKIFDVQIPVDVWTRLHYSIRPVVANGQFAAVDLYLEDSGGSPFWLSTSGAVDQHGIGIGAAQQGAGGQLVAGQYNDVETTLGHLAGKTIKQIVVAYDQPNGSGGYQALFDDVEILDGGEAPPPLISSGVVWVQGRKLDENSRPYFGAGTTVDPAGSGSTCGASYANQSGSQTACNQAVNPYFAATVVVPSGFARITTDVPAGRDVLVSVCTDGTGYPGQYECADHPAASYCRPAQTNTAEVKLWVLPNRTPAYADLWWKYVPESQIGGIPSCDLNGYPKVYSTASLGTGSRGDIDEDGYLTAEDAVRVVRCAVGEPIGAPGNCMPRGDYDLDGSVTLKDAAQLFRVTAGKSLPEPYFVKPVYFVPRDVTPDHAWRRKMQTAMELILQFYTEEMQRLGFGYRPFNMELQPDGRPAVYLIRGHNNLSGYSSIPNTAAGAMSGEVLFDASRTFVALIENTKAGFTGAGGVHTGWASANSLITYSTPSIAAQLQLFCDETPDPFGTVGVSAGVVLGGFAHEMGHAFNIVHHGLWGTYDSLMTFGNYTFGSYFVGCQGSPPPEWQFPYTIANSAFFRAATSYTDTVAPSVTVAALPAVHSGDPITIDVTVTDTGSGPAVLHLATDRYWNGALFREENLSGAGSTVHRVFTYTPFEPLAAGQHEIAVTAFDGDGNFTAGPYPFQVLP